MSVTYGFYNSVNGDRKYDTRQFSNLIGNLVIDGVFASVGTAFVVNSAGGLNITVGAGKAWFNNTWTWNDSVLPLTLSDAELLLNRIDAVVLEVDESVSARSNSIKIITGVSATNAARPTMINTETIHQYPLCYIYRAAGSTAVTQADITNMVGSVDTPFITGVLQTVSLDELLGQWRTQLDQFVAREDAELDEFTVKKETEFDEWFDQLKADLTSEMQLLDQWITSEQEDFLAWYQRMKDQLSEDAAGNLQAQIDKADIDRILLIGFVDGSKAFSEDGTTIISTDTDGNVLTKTFTNMFLTMTTVLSNSSGDEIARMVKNFSSDGKLIDTVVTYS